jgi:hypothetical protein
VWVPNDGSNELSRIDPATGAKTPYLTVTLNASTTAGLAYDASTRTLWTTSTGNDSLFTIDLGTGTATLVGPYGDSAIVMHGLEWDSSTGTLYGVSSHNNGLYRINTSTGAATLIGTTGLSSFTNLVHHSTSNVMYATNSGSDSFYSIDRTTGAATLIGPLNGPTNPNGLAFDSDTGTVFLVCNSTDTLYTIDVTTGAATAVGSNGAGNLLGLVYIPRSGRIGRIPHGCGPTTIAVTGQPQIGGTIDISLGGVVGVPVIGIGFTVQSLPFCTCTIGHDWGIPLFGSSLSMAVPYNPAIVGLQFGVQGLDFGGTGGCAAPQLTLTDTMVVVLGG